MIYNTIPFPKDSGKGTRHARLWGAHLGRHRSLETFLVLLRAPKSVIARGITMLWLLSFTTCQFLVQSLGLVPDLPPTVPS
jgi:hypothetical protein